MFYQLIARSDVVAPALYQPAAGENLQLPLLKREFVREQEWVLAPEVLAFLRKAIPEEIEKTILIKDAREFRPYVESYRKGGSSSNGMHLKEAVTDDPCDLFVSFQRIDRVRYVNKYLESLNENLVNDGFLFGCMETLEQRRKRLFFELPSYVRNFLLIVDFLVQQSWPKINYLNRLYFFLTKGKKRVMSQIEMNGRLISCGFVLKDTMEFEGRTYFIAKKVRRPEYNCNASYFPVIALKRLGKNSKLIKVYKFRTMYPYAEYLQEKIYRTNGLDEGGKFKGDIRVTPEGRLARKYFLDEIPMLINLIKGDLKLFGVRPLSPHYLSLYPKRFQLYRSKFKPGLIPPYYVDMPKTLKEIVRSERKYLLEYEKSPFYTDIRYTFLAFYRILFRKARSH